jgi:hypothetical protein
MPKTIDTTKTTAILAGFPIERLAEELKARGFVPSADDSVANAQMLAVSCRSLDDVVVTLVNLTHGEVDSEAVTSLLAAAFPAHRIGERHGAHYISLCRTGNISSKFPVRFTPGRARKSVKAAPAAKTYDLSNVPPAQLKKLAAAAKGTDLEQLIAGFLAAKSEE